MAVEDSVAQDQLRAFLERIERMEEEKAAIAADIKEIYAEAKGNGFDTKILRKIVTIRKQDANERMEQEAILDLYMGALGMIPAPDGDDDPTPRRRTDTRTAPANAVGNSVAALRANPAASVVAATKINSPSQSAPQAGSDLTNAPPSTGQVAQFPLGGNDAGKSVEASASAAPVSYPEPGEVYWENTPRQPVHRHEYSAAFGDLGQDPHVINDDITRAMAAPIVMIGDVILDGWARYNCARCTKGIDGQTTHYPAVQYAGADPLIDCIRLNMEGRMLNEGQMRTIMQRLVRIEPKRKADIFRAMDMGMELVA